MIVLDASAVVEWLLLTTAGHRIADRLLASGETLHAPHLLDLEVAQVLRRCVATDVLTAVRALQAMEDFQDLPVRRYPHTRSYAGFGSFAKISRPTTPYMFHWQKSWGRHSSHVMADWPMPPDTTLAFN